MGKTAPKTDSSADLVLEYLKKENRPYSAIEVSANLHNKVTKTQAAKVLKELDESKLITSKTAGKQSVYHAIQNPEEFASLEDLAQMDQEIAVLRDTTATLKTEERGLRSNLQSSKMTLSLSELKDNSYRLDLEISELRTRLEAFQSGSVKPISAKEKEATRQQFEQWSQRSKRRKQICMEFWGMLTEEMPAGMSKDELWEARGLV